MLSHEVAAFGTQLSTKETPLMATLDPATAGVYEVGNDQVPEVYRPFFDNGDWTQHTLTVYGSWVFFVIAVIAHIFVWLWRPW
jgi:hypothetical protein